MTTLEKIIISISATTSVMVVGIFTYLNYIYEKPLISDQKELAEMAKNAERALNPKTLKLDKIATNLHSSRGRLRYISIEAYVQPFQEHQLAKLQEAEALIYDSILGTAGRSVPDELNTLAGKILFENQIKRKINSRLPIPLVKKIFFAAFVIQ